MQVTTIQRRLESEATVEWIGKRLRELYVDQGLVDRLGQLPEVSPKVLKDDRDGMALVKLAGAMLVSPDGLLARKLAYPVLDAEGRPIQRADGRPEVYLVDRVGDALLSYDRDIGNIKQKNALLDELTRRKRQLEELLEQLIHVDVAPIIPPDTVRGRLEPNRAARKAERTPTRKGRYGRIFCEIQRAIEDLDRDRQFLLDGLSTNDDESVSKVGQAKNRFIWRMIDLDLSAVVVASLLIVTGLYVESPKTPFDAVVKSVSGNISDAKKRPRPLPFDEAAAKHGSDRP